MLRRIVVLALVLSFVLCADNRPVTAIKGSIAPIGPYSPAVFAGDYLYISGQGAKTPNGQLPASFPDQVNQTLENLKTLVEAAGLTMKNVVYVQIYLKDMQRFDEMNQIYAKYFSETPPARATLGVANLPGQTPIEMNAVAVRDLGEKQAVQVPGYDPQEPLTPGILTKDRLYISALRSKYDAPEAQTEASLANMKAVVSAAGLTMANMVFVNPYLTSRIPAETMNRIYAKQFAFGNTPARATIQVTSLPRNAGIEFTGVAARKLADRKAVRPKNMPPSPTASPCVFAGETLYCSAKSGFVPGPNSGVFTLDISLQLRQTMRNLLDNLEEADLDFKDVVATNVYIDDLQDFSEMNQLYAKFFIGVLPARTTIQQIAPVSRSRKPDDTYPELEQISLIAVKHIATRPGQK